MDNTTQQLPRANGDPWHASQPEPPTAPLAPPAEPPTPPPGSVAEPVSSPRARRGLAVLLAAALAGGLVGGGAGAAATYRLVDDNRPVSALQTPAGTTTTSQAATGSVEQVAARVLPSVVSVNVRGGGGQGTGSGVILSSDGLILTNNHVVESAANGGNLSVTFHDGRTAQARVTGQDPTTDLAVIKAEGVNDLQPARLGRSSDLRVGQQVVAVGSPLGLSGTVTAGIVSALNRPVRAGGSELPGQDRSTVLDAIQTDAPINPGNSGGPLVNMNGEVVGINSAIATMGRSLGGQQGNIGVGFAIPIDQARPIAQQLADGGRAEHAQLGVSVRDSVSDAGAGQGAELAEVSPGGAAAQAGLRAGDVVTRFGERQIDSADALVAAVRSHRPGESVQVTYLRDGRSATATVQLTGDGGA
jgi:putative serine protease PepD